jgi:hypothetical protein
MQRKTILIATATVAALCSGSVGRNTHAQALAAAAKGAVVPDYIKANGIFDFKPTGASIDGRSQNRGGSFQIGMTYERGATVGKASSILQIDEASVTIRSFLSKNPEALETAIKKAFPESVTAVELMGRGGTATSQRGLVRLAIRSGYSRTGGRNGGSIEPSREVPEGMQYLVLDVSVIAPEVSWPSSDASGKNQIPLRKLARVIAETLAKGLPDFSVEHLKTRLADRAAQTDLQLKQAEVERLTAQKMLAESTGLPSEKTAEQLAEVSRQLIGARLALVGMEAREAAIADQIKKTETKMAGATESDETLRGLEKLLMLRNEQLGRLKTLRSNGAVAESEVQTAEAGVLSAKIELDKSKAAIKRASGGERLEKFNDELSRLAIDRAEAKARLAYLEKASEMFAQELRERQAAERRGQEANPALKEATRQVSRLSAELATIKAAQEHIEPIRIILPPEEAESAEKPKQ